MRGFVSSVFRVEGRFSSDYGCGAVEFIFQVQFRNWDLGSGRLSAGSMNC